jgi:2-deoxy-D-gluconate 3-dehydrogenase
MSRLKDLEPLGKLIDLSGRNALVTGGASGIGLAICARLAEAGAGVYIVDVDAEQGRSACRELREAGFRCSCGRCDVRDEPSVEAVVKAAVREMDGIHILVNNAGVYPRKPLAEMRAEDFHRVIAVNLTGTFLFTRCVSEAMVARKRGGCIINIASIEALHPSSTEMSAYDASKGGVLAFTRSTARELGNHDIRVNAIAPGGIMTRGVAAQFGTGGDVSEAERKAQLKELKSFMRRMVLGRMGAPDDVARAALFLVSELSSYVTGELIVVDGGYLIS